MRAFRSPVIFGRSADFLERLKDFVMAIARASPSFLMVCKECATAPGVNTRTNPKRSEIEGTPSVHFEALHQGGSRCIFGSLKKVVKLSLASVEHGKSSSSLKSSNFCASVKTFRFCPAEKS
jgi:hypothetical protein